MLGEQRGGDLENRLAAVAPAVLRRAVFRVVVF